MQKSYHDLAASRVLPPARTVRANGSIDFCRYNPLEAEFHGLTHYAGGYKT
jgi:hypothetical protein